ncbi:hypothetical protein L2E82_42607 [Cichorium intybus]|uniref:Uncharacterized protein n=1 Tax=Cichorium intybus TaxID=13427 RepID=A0ACB8ZN90_CICIN|nr:hypothetical protein L2E82_42607 [Cichorium intybus]
MPRNKLKLAFISDNNARRTSFRKRKDGIKKKLNELCTLCGVDACAIIYTPNEPEPDVWPSKNGVENVLDQFNQMPDTHLSRKMYNHDSYIEKRITKTMELLNKQIKENREKELANKMSECLTGERSVDNLILEDLNDLVSLADKKVLEIDTMIELLKKRAPAAAPIPQSQRPQPQSFVCYTNTDNHMATGGVAADCYVPVVEDPFTLDGMQTAEWFPEWIDNMGEHYLGNSQGDDVNRHSFIEDPNPFWPGASSSKAS